MVLGFKDFIESFSVILTEGAVIERLRRTYPDLLNPFVAHAGAVFNSTSREILKSIYREYLNIGFSFNLPMIMLTPTWRASSERAKLAGLDWKEINKGCVNFLKEIKMEYGVYAEKIMIGGLMGCRNDAYDATQSLEEDTAFEFHQPQAEELSKAGVDFLIASTIPSFSEALGMARAMTLFKDTIISFVIRENGKLLDGMVLSDTINRIDSGVEVLPTGYMVNCVHPLIFQSAMNVFAGSDPGFAGRLIGLQANTSKKSPEELDGSLNLDAEDPQIFGKEVDMVRRKFELKIVGGCCGTDARHIREIAMRVKEGN